MSDIQTAIEDALKDVKPLLKGAGRDIVVTDAAKDRIRLRLDGFCSGCGCGDSYKEGLREMLAEKVPGLVVDFE